MTQVNDEIEELNNLKRAASERRAKRTKPKSKSKKKPAAKTASEAASKTADGVGEEPPPVSDDSDESPLRESEEIVHQLADQMETIFSEIGEASSERPALALVSAFAAGILIGYIFAKR
jgi:hypothetical protein